MLKPTWHWRATREKIERKRASGWRRAAEQGDGYAAYRYALELPCYADHLVWMHRATELGSAAAASSLATTAEVGAAAGRRRMRLGADGAIPDDETRHPGITNGGM